MEKELKKVETEELYALFRRCFPFLVREEGTARNILADAGNTVLTRRNETGELIGASVIHGDTVYLLCVDEKYRNRGLGGGLLAETEDFLRRRGYGSIRIGAGDDYLAPGVPTGVQPFREKLGPEALCPELAGKDGAAFFKKRGYRHGWGEANCFDMRVDLKAANFSGPGIGEKIDGILYRWADPADMERAAACVNSAEEEFTKYYQNPALYCGGQERVLLALAGETVCGALIVSAGTEAPGLGSVGCTAVAPGFRGRHIGVNLTVLGTGYLKGSGLEHGFLGYTYSGLDKMYGYAGYKICAYYYMAEKGLNF